MGNSGAVAGAVLLKVNGFSVIPKGKSGYQYGHDMCYPQLVGTITLNSGRRSSKNIYEIIKNLPGWGRSFSDLLHFRDWFQIKMNFNRNVSCLIAVYFFMDNDFFNQLV